MRHFMVLTTRHQDEDRNEYVRGDIVNSHRDLCKDFPLKFQELSDHEMELRDAAKTKKIKRKVKEEEADDREPLGEDVTEDFDVAVKAQVKVFRNGRNFFVTDLADVFTPLNTDKLTKTKVADFIRDTFDLAEGGDEEEEEEEGADE